MSPIQLYVDIYTSGCNANVSDQGTTEFSKHTQYTSCENAAHVYMVEAKKQQLYGIFM